MAGAPCASGHGDDGTKYTCGTMQLPAVALAPGECFLVGGPSGDAGSGFTSGPVFDHAQDFNPDIQNSGATADGLALFELPAGSIGPASVPIDAVIYGTTNTNGLLDATGAVGALDVGDAPAESSIRLRSDDTWVINPAPAPLDCIPFPDP